VGFRVYRTASDDVSGSNVGVHVPFDSRPGTISPLGVRCRQKHNVLLRYCEGPRRCCVSFYSSLIYSFYLSLLQYIIDKYY
jgi:hypothetical protein